MRRALGKGLTQLMGEQSESGTDSLPISAIRPNTQQPRRYFDDDALAELANSISEVGILLPLIVRPISEDKYELIAGERRLRAAEIAGLEEVPVIIRAASAQSSLEIALIENVQREDISAIECAYAYKELIDKFDLSQEEVAQKVGKSRAAIANTVRLLQLPEEMQHAISDGFMSEGHARAILMADDANKRQALFKKILNDGISVREAEKLARNATTSGSSNGKTQATQQDTPRTDDPNMKALEQRLSEHLGTPVTLHSTGIGGKMVVEYYSDEDLQRILDVLGVEL